MKYLNTYNNFLNEAWFPGKRKLMKQKEELEKQGKELDDKSKKIKEESDKADNEYKEAMDKADKATNDIIKHFINQKFKFQYLQTVWKSSSSNYSEIDTVDFIFKGVKIEWRWDWDSGAATEIYFTMKLIDRYDKEVDVVFDEKSPTDKKLDLEYCKPWDRNFSTILHGNYTTQTKIDYDNPNSYPHKQEWMDLVPAEYATYNLLGELKAIIQQANEEIKLRNSK